MKGRFVKVFSLDMERVVAVGSEVDVIGGVCGCNGYQYACMIHGRCVYVDSAYLDIVDQRPWVDWDKVLVDASVGAMAGLLRERLGTVAEIDGKAEEVLAEVSVGYGRALVERLRKETGR